MRSGDPEASSRVLRGHSDWVNRLSFSADGMWLATGSEDHTARLWNMTASDPAESAQVLVGHDGPILALAFSADGQRLATGSADGTARLWNVAAGTQGPGATEAAPAALRGHESAVTSLAFSPDGKWLATGSEDRTVRLWLTGLDALTAAACQSAGRNFTQEEWRQFFPGKDYAVTCEQWPASR